MYLHKTKSTRRHVPHQQCNTPDFSCHASVLPASLKNSNYIQYNPFFSGGKQHSIPYRSNYFKGFKIRYPLISDNHLFCFVSTLPQLKQTVPPIVSHATSVFTKCGYLDTPREQFRNLNAIEVRYANLHSYLHCTIYYAYI